LPHADLSPQINSPHPYYGTGTADLSKKGIYFLNIIFCTPNRPHLGVPSARRSSVFEFAALLDCARFYRQHVGTFVRNRIFGRHRPSVVLQPGDRLRAGLRTAGRFIVALSFAGPWRSERAGKRR
jgi:hypothetical protein